ncbi:MAG: hypothetical protein P4M14_03970 [Gammaproteobacteria bacterium]|nr:hypothetical protein [Gammaproteobacteria bacterium]
MGNAHDVPFLDPASDLAGSLQGLNETEITQLGTHIQQQISQRLDELNQSKKAIPSSPESNQHRTLQQEIIQYENQLEKIAQHQASEALHQKKLKTESLINKLGISQTLYRELIEPRLKERALNKKKFDVAFARFTLLLDSTGNVESFIDILKSIAAKGIAETHLRKNKTSAIYHDAPHAAEVANNVDDLLKKYYQQDTHSDKTTAKIMSAIAVAAGACHDIIQEQSTSEHLIANETRSAALFAEYLKKAIETILQPSVLKSASKKSAPVIANVILDFKKMLPFLAAELIVPTTYLVRPTNRPLASYISQFEALTISAKKKTAMNYLDEAALAISFCDTNRNLLLNTINNRVEMKELAYICQHQPASTNAMNSMFVAIDANSEQKKESFLLALGASLRMFPELNPFRSGEDKLDNTELAQLIQKMDRARTADPAELKHDGYAKYFNQFLNRLDMSIQFAESIDYQNFANMAEINHASNLLKDVDRNGWRDHATQLPHLKTHWNTLNPEQKENLASTLFNLAARQEGARLVQSNTEVQKRLNSATLGKTAPAAGRNRFFTPQKKLPVEAVFTTAQTPTKKIR